MARLRKIKNRAGDLVPFRQSRIAESIREAVSVCGGEDDILAEELAGVVTLFLEKNYDDDNPPELDDIDEMVERVLTETGHRRVAQAYKRLSSKGIAAAPVAGTVPNLEVPSEFDFELDQPRPVAAIDVVDGHDQLARVFDGDRLVAALIRQLGLADSEARELAIDVESRLLRSGLSRVPSTLIRELVDAELAARGQESLLKRHRLFGVSASEVEAWIFPDTPAGRDPVEEAGNRILSDYALEEIFSRPVAKAHYDGRLHINGVGQPQRVDELIFDATGPLFPESGRTSDFLLELLTRLQSVRPLVGRRITVLRFAEAYARYAPVGVQRRGVQAFARRLLELLTKVDVFGRPLLPALNLELHLTGDHLAPADDAEAEDADQADSNHASRVVRLLSETLLQELEARPKLRGRLGLSFLLSAAPPFEWPESKVLDSLLAAARKHRGVSLRLLRSSDEVDQGGGRGSRDAVRLEVGAVAINLPLALAMQDIDSFEEVTSLLSGAVGLAVDALFEKYWFLRRSAPETLRGLLTQLPGGRGLKIEGADQGARLEIWGLPQAMSMLKRQGLIAEGEEPKAIARILQCADYLSGEERDSIRLDISIGGVTELEVRKRLIEAAEAHALRLGHEELAAAINENAEDSVSLPILSPLSRPENQPLLSSPIVERISTGLPLPARGNDEIANGVWLRRLFEETRLRYVELEERSETVEFQEKLFGEGAGS